jgi:hypothetical protein
MHKVLGERLKDYLGQQALDLLEESDSVEIHSAYSSD